mgnify:CR=1 FL=1
MAKKQDVLNRDKIKKIQKIERIILAKKDMYPVEEFLSKKKSGDILDVVVKTILSQNTSDNLRDIAFENLKRRFKDMREILHADEAEVVELIRVCGLPRVKLKRIKSAIEKITQRFENPEELCKLAKDSAFSFLTSIDGIGPKSAEVILAFGCGFDTFPVDTHVSRIIRRLGIADGSREKIYHLVSPHFKNKILSHVFLIHHGRKICKASNPLCSLCVFKRYCDYYTRRQR